MARRVRVRFAPSPTGPLHIGGVRTALFNYLFARKHQGDFILRIEDTDQVRYVPGAEKYITDALQWCGLQYSEGPGVGGPYEPYRQSDRKGIYRQYADALVRTGHAYIAFDTPESIDALRRQAESEGRTFQYDAVTRTSMINSLTLDPGEVQERLEGVMPYVIRFRMSPGEEVRINDMIRGEVTFNTSLLDDKVLMKADGLPTYHLAHLVDDYLMQVSHVIRGEEWLPSLPLHVLMYRALGWEKEMPEFAHLPLILKPSGQGKLSKRDGDKLGFPVFPLQWTDPESSEVSSGYRESGYFPEAVVNILAFLGWNPGTEQELFSLEELAGAFSLDRVGKSGARFDPEKARWYNQQYLKARTDEELARLCLPVLEKRGIRSHRDYVALVVSLVKERMVFPGDIWEQAHYFFRAPASFDRDMLKKVWKDDTPVILADLMKVLEQAGDFSSAGLEALVKQYIEEKGLGFGRVMSPLRLLLVGSGIGPHLFRIMEVLGKEETLERIKRGLNSLDVL